MDITINPKKLSGTIAAIPSKSQAHRLLICAAFSDGPTELFCPETNQDIEATADCLRSLGADIVRTTTGYLVQPAAHIPKSATLNCRESGSTLRFMLPIAGALGVEATFLLAGRLPKRPLSPMWEEMERMGCILSRPTENTIACNGQLKPGNYTIDGGVSSQFITGLLFAMALIPGNNTLSVTGKIESKPYINMTCRALEAFGVNTKDFTVSGSMPFKTPSRVHVEGDWSNASFFLAAKRLGNDVEITGLDPASPQGDRAVTQILAKMDENIVVDAADIPDAVPILAVTAGAMNGATFYNIARLRLKESDRVATVSSMLERLGAKVTVNENEMTVYPTPYRSCTIDAAGDHRIAMAAAIAATVARGTVTILGAQCVAKSYPKFWDEYKRLGGSYEQYIR